MPKSDKGNVLCFQLTDEQARSIKAIAGGKGVRISGYVDGNKVKVDSIAINAGVVGVSSAPFSDNMAPFIACNGVIETVDNIGRVGVQKV
ncbi:MAG TPA: hypothetical protein VEA60_00865 [Allosphingosinicella sp.]|nr:hypothetical protein [Allosphingosinicella sp.]